MSNWMIHLSTLHSPGPAQASSKQGKAGRQHLLTRALDEKAPGVNLAAGRDDPKGEEQSDVLPVAAMQFVWMWQRRRAKKRRRSRVTSCSPARWADVRTWRTLLAPACQLSSSSIV